MANILLRNRGSRLQWLLMACAVGCVVTLVVLSWSPGQYMVRTGILSGFEEHFLAYALSGIMVAAAMRKASPVCVVAFFVFLAAMLELGQNFVPGRHPAIEDFFASTAGALAGVALIWLAILLVNWKERSDLGKRS